MTRYKGILTTPETGCRLTIYADSEQEIRWQCAAYCYNSMKMPHTLEIEKIEEKKKESWLMRFLTRFRDLVL